ncbi:MAG: 2-oxo acid dehydrogenase subunit E2 [Clostridium sp.]|uniref:2-oxo acid dehydrogenase subunit E2 n=1 Tax=Clostridium sp. TaxID=1506 RepID=UPI0025BBAC74|nr:2-oxo acid dehydrogenase subunit E2 [Clostridium sp.]MCH3963630.1 2-oxo acid dehydrogenase subunit E2 [Clostridium sp.]MCI1714771.1 2-oxo acid dehydrogenase subunit E2 [Clostridium sp.]MCI1799040.1 2-oxo acid dehydrogenase subunit E2 [Clostridium sp.]MCI1812954.1 2-oxo acid dehydrogenase subunit E2 [Clostridium sp.]MCI1869844.1 2-oxo acid dehydrogenase subunit E2 [Clostridium sp.]
MSCIEVMPKLGLTMTEGEIEAWHKKEGDEVKKGEILFDVTTDKLTNEVEAKESGVLRKILVEEGESANCLAPVAIIADEGEDISHLLGEFGKVIPVEMHVSGDENEQHLKRSIPVKREGRIRISPLARKIAIQNGVDYEAMTGTGPLGRIIRKDVEGYIENNRIKVSPAASKLAQKLNVDLNSIKKQGRIMKEDVLKAAGKIETVAKTPEEKLERKSQTEVESRDEKVIDMSPMRKVIAARMSESTKISPTVTYDITVDVSELKRFKDRLKDTIKITYTDFLIKMVSTALKQFPLVNCSVSGNKFILKNYVNMGIAVALDEGLIVPVVKDSDIKGLKEITLQLGELVRKAKENRLSPDDMTGGTFTITNLGMFGIDSFSPIINQPEVAILGVNRIVETPVAEDGKIVVKPLLKLSLTADHRAIDGAYAARFLKKIKEYMEKPELMLL